MRLLIVEDSVRLQQSLTNEQMMGVAESTHVIQPKKTAKPGSENE